jgi:hypothetical protein
LRRFAEPDLVEPDADGGFGYVEQFSEVAWSLDAVVVGGAEQAFGHQDAAGEVVGDDFCRWPLLRCCGSGEPDAGAAVVEGVFVLV